MKVLKKEKRKKRKKKREKRVKRKKDNFLNSDCLTYFVDVVC